MSVREFVVLGTAGQAPTRRRNHNGYLLRWDHAGSCSPTSRSATPDPDAFAREAAAVFGGDLVVAADLIRVPVPPRAAPS